jgi:hypothetical protein
VGVLDGIVTALFGRFLQRPKLSMKQGSGYHSDSMGLTVGVEIRNQGERKAWDTTVKATMDGKDVATVPVPEIPAEKTVTVTFQIPAGFCERRPGVGQVPKGDVRIDLLYRKKRIGSFALQMP